MKNNFGFQNKRLMAALSFIFGVASTSLLGAEIELLGSVSIPGDTADMSGLPGSIGQGTPHNLFGAVSGLEYLGANRYLALADRGPLDGASQFQCRFHEIELTLSSGESKLPKFKLIGTTMLANERGTPLVGALEAFNETSPKDSLRFDPEAIRMSDSKTFFISDEYGPSLYEFDPSGVRKRILTTPPEFSIKYPSDNPKTEDQLNETGRAANSGWEGMAITPDRSRLLIATQKTMLQDRLVVDGQKSPTRVVRFLEIDLRTEATRQLVYLLDASTNGISELLAVSSNSFLVLERDSLKGSEAKMKRIYRVSTDQATDVSRIKSLAGDDLPSRVTPLKKTLLIDLLSPEWGFAGDQCPEKWEGLAFGPDLEDSRKLLWVATDNDYVPSAPSSFHAFAIDKAELPGIAWTPTNSQPSSSEFSSKRSGQ